jgi:hypothetical protein
MIGFAGFDRGVNGAGHLCADVGVGLAAQIQVLAILSDVSLELVVEAIGLLQNGSLLIFTQTGAGFFTEK